MIQPGFTSDAQFNPLNSSRYKPPPKSYSSPFFGWIQPISCLASNGGKILLSKENQPMETKDNQTTPESELQPWEQDQKRGKIVGGFVIVVAGALLLARELGTEIPYWIFSWKFIIIVVGLVMGIKHGFRRAFWIFPVLVGSAFLFMDFYPDVLNRNLIWPLILMAFGVAVMLKPYRRRRFGNPNCRKKKWNSTLNPPSPTDPPMGDPVSDSTFEFTVVMGGIQKYVLAKDFREGEVNAVLGGVQLNMAQADIVKQARLEINAVMGGVKLIIPANWEIKSEISCVAGGIEDKRNIQPTPEGTERKLLILEGNIFLGGVEIRNY